MNVKKYAIIFFLFIWQLPEQDNIYSNFAAHLEYHLACFIKLMRDSCCGPWRYGGTWRQLKSCPDKMTYWNIDMQPEYICFLLGIVIFILFYEIYCDICTAMCNVHHSLYWNLMKSWCIHICTQFTAVVVCVLIWALLVCAGGGVV